MNTVTTQSSKYFTFALLFLLGAYVLLSYPMLFPGYDHAFHLFYIEKPYHTYNNSWHIFWKYVFENLFVTDDRSLRALVIHRAQTFILFSLIAATTYIFITATIKNLDFHTAFQLSLVSVVLWATMHGTFSSPRDGDGSVRHIQSWIQWYSVNYQISLPIFMFSTMAFLKACLVDFPVGWKWYLVALFGAIAISLIHSAELVYFIFSASYIFFLYFISRRGWLESILIVAFIAACVVIGLLLSYRKPMLLQFIMDGNYESLLVTVQSFNNFLIDSGQNRLSTGWHAVYIFNFSMCLLTLLYIFIKSGFNSDLAMVRKALIFILLSSIPVIFLLFPYSSAFLALIVGEGVAWRFSFSSFLYLSLPLVISFGLVNFAHLLSPVKSSLVIVVIPFVFLMCFAIWSLLFEYDSPTYNFILSMYYSLTVEKSSFITPYIQN